MRPFFKGRGLNCCDRGENRLFVWFVGRASQFKDTGVNSSVKVAASLVPGLAGQSVDLLGKQNSTAVGINVHDLGSFGREAAKRMKEGATLAPEGARVGRTVIEPA